ncbi:hypothetical protein ONZ45_g1352 [Pleurotus djamor]|nr:hypothetical protein ONZ45_g1352 [Pleurotus djamor]
MSQAQDKVRWAKHARQHMLELLARSQTMHLCVRCTLAPFPNEITQPPILPLRWYHREASKPRGPPKAYVTGLEDKLDRLEALLKKASFGHLLSHTFTSQILRPNVDFSEELGPPVVRDSWKSSSMSIDRLKVHERNASPSLPTIFPSLDSEKSAALVEISIGTPPLPPGSTNSKRRSKHIKTEPNDNAGYLVTHFPSDTDTMSSQESEDVSESSVALARLTLRGTKDIKEEEDANLLRYHGHSSQVTFAEAAKKFKQRKVQEATVSSPQFLGQTRHHRHQNEAPDPSRPRRVPIQRSVYWSTPPWELTWEGLKDESTVFLSRFLCNLPPADLSRSLFDIYFLNLQANYLRGTPMYPTGWLFVSIGIRKCQDLGAHRKSSYHDPPTVDEEQWRRVFWLMVALDRVVSAALGRPAVTAEADFDIDLPLEVDDEYWESGFKQPLNKPSTVSFFNCWAKLSRIVAFATKTIYAVNKSKVFIGPNMQRWPEEVLKKMDDTLADFLDRIPPHLRWSPLIENQIFSNQSASLYITYYLTQILIHRPFIVPDPSMSTTLVEPPARALEICTNAAKACARILDAQLPKGFTSTPTLINCAHICAATLLMKVWDIKTQAQQRATGFTKGDAREVESHLKDVDMFVRTMETLQPHWEIVDIFIGILKETLPSLNTEKFNAPAPFRNVPFTGVYHPHLPAPVPAKHTRPPRPSIQEPHPAEIPSSFENGWQWYAPATPFEDMDTTVPVEQYSHYVPSQYDVRPDMVPTQPYRYESTVYAVDRSMPPPQHPPIEVLQYYPTSYAHPAAQPYRPHPPHHAPRNGHFCLLRSP